MIGERYRKYLIGKRQCLIMELGLLEDFIDIERSIIPRHKRGGKEEFTDKEIEKELKTIGKVRQK